MRLHADTCLLQAAGLQRLPHPCPCHRRSAVARMRPDLADTPHPGALQLSLCKAPSRMRCRYSTEQSGVAAGSGQGGQVVCWRNGLSWG